MDKEYYSIPELTERWDFCLHDALYMAENGMCQFFVNLSETEGILYQKAINNGLNYELPVESCKVNGLLPLEKEDVRRLLIYKSAIIVKLAYSEHMNGYVKLNIPTELTVNDVVIRYKDKLQLEKELGFFDKKAKIKNTDIRHNIDDFFIEELPNGFTKFSYHGKNYIYGIIQSNIIKQLYEAAKDGRIWLYGKTLLKNAGSSSYRLGDVFKPHKDWMDLIKGNNQGLYRLYLD